jgi:hypothetical protein
MLRFKTHYEQVPLAIIKKILEEQIQQEAIIGPDDGTSKNTQQEDSMEEPQQTVAVAGGCSQKEPSTKS